MAATKKNESPATPGFEGMTPLDPKQFADWTEEQVGFAPYFSAAEGAKFYAVPVELDNRQPKFVRVLFMAEHDTACFTGPTDDQTPTVVKKGEFFTLSLYAGLEEKFVEYLSCPFPVPCLVECKEKVRIADGEDGPRFFWKWSIKVSPETAKKLQGPRAERNALRAAQIHKGELVAKNA